MSGNIKFPMHDLHLNKSIKGVYKASFAALVAAAIFGMVYCAPRKSRVGAFYTNYDSCKSFERMKEGGYLQSCPSSADEKAKAEKEKK